VSANPSFIESPNFVTSKYTSKLHDVRFTTRNGSIMILKRDSRQADVVLPPNEMSKVANSQAHARSGGPPEDGNAIGCLLS
jgi:hypothetical protein